MECSYPNFVFYGSWRELLNGFPEDKAKELLWQIMLAGTDSDLTTDDPMIRGIIQGAVAPNIRKAQERYADAIVNGKKGGRPKIDLPMDEIVLLHQKGISTKIIADKYSVSRDTIRRRLQDCSETDEAKAKAQQNLDIDINTDIEKNKDCDTLASAFWATGFGGIHEA